MILLNGLSFFAVIWQLRRMDESLLHPPGPASTPGMLRRRRAYVRSQPTMMLVLVLVFFAGTFGMNFQITSALMATEVYGKGAGEFGVLGSAIAVGSLTGALLAARARDPAAAALSPATGSAIAEILAGLMPSFLTFALFAPVIGLFVITLLNSANATMQMASDPAYRGRVMALYMTVVMGGTPLGAPLIGYIGEDLGARWTLIIGGALVLVGVGLAVLVYERSSAGRKNSSVANGPPTNAASASSSGRGAILDENVSASS